MMRLLVSHMKPFQSWAIASAVFHLLTLVAAEFILPTPQDPRFMLNWLEMASERGFLSVYSWTDQEVADRFNGGFNANYPPLYFWFFHPLYSALQMIGIWPVWPSPGINLFFRLPIAVGQWLLFLAVLRQTPPSRSARGVAFAFFSVNPALLLAGPVWGQFDVLLWGIMYFSLGHQAQGRDLGAGVLSGFGAMSKPQFLLFAPLVVFLSLRRHSLTGFGKWGLGFALVVVALAAPFALSTGTAWLRAGYSRAATEGAVGVTSTAFNFWWVAHAAGIAAMDSDRVFGVTCKHFGMLVVAVVGGLAGLLYVVGRPRSWVGLSTVYLLACFLFLTGLSERFLVFGAASAAAWAVFDRRVLIPASLLNCLLVVNLLHNCLHQPASRWGGFVTPEIADVVSLTASGLAVVCWTWLAAAYLFGGPNDASPKHAS